MPQTDLVIRNARLRRAPGSFDILIDRGQIVGIKRSGPHTGATTIDAAGGLVTESHIIADLHLDKVDTLLLIGDRALRHYHVPGMAHAATAILLAAAVNVALSQDDCNDAYYPYGRADMLEVAFLASHLLRMMILRDMDLLYDMITTNAAKAIGSPTHTLQPGAKVNLLVYQQQTVAELLRHQPRPATVIRDGRVVAAQHALGAQTRRRARAGGL